MNTSDSGIDTATGKGLSWPTLLWGLALYMALMLNAPVLVRRLTQLQTELGFGWAAIRVALEVFLVLGTSALLLLMARCSGRWGFRLLAAFMLIFSVLASYYMTFFKVVIGYGVVQAVLTTDVDLSKEALGFGLLVWFVLAVSPGLALLWWYRPASLLGPREPWRQRLRSMAHRGVAGVARPSHLLHVLLAGAVALLAYWALNFMGLREKKDDAVMIKPAVLAAHSYVPSNWIAGLGMSVSHAWSRARQDQQLGDPARLFDYVPTAPLDDMVVVMVIGESARSTNFGALGYERPTTPQLSGQMGNGHWAMFKAKSCNTSTKLSLQCMFVRPTAVHDKGLQAPVITERPVFSVLKKLGFSIDLFAMQSEVWFYNTVAADFYKIREVIAADPKNAGKPSYDTLLLDEVAETLQRHPKGKRLIILHTKGSHYLYTSRYPREFAKFQPECAGIDASCTQTQLINSYDNSILYLDDFLMRLTGVLSPHKAMVVYTSDHGESIGENLHFHATPKPLAPPDQRAVPLMVWASSAYLQEPALAQGFGKLKARAAAQERSDAAPVGHDNLFDSLLGCLGVTSRQGGLNPQLNLCH